MSRSFESSRAPEPVGAFPHAKRVGDLLFLSGIGPRVRGSKEIPGVTLDSAGNITSYDIETQCRAVFENVAACGWNAFGSGDPEGPYVYVEGTFKGRELYLRVLAEAPDDEEPSLKLDAT